MFECDPFDHLLRTFDMLRLLHLSLIGLMLIVSIAVASSADVGSSSESAFRAFDSNGSRIINYDDPDFRFLEKIKGAQ